MQGGRNLMENASLEEQSGQISVSAHVDAEQVLSLPALIRECLCS